MPLYDHPDLGEVTRHYYFKGEILELDTGNDLAKVTVPALPGIPGGYNWIPIYYHCEPDSTLRSNGALEGSALAFKSGDQVVVRYRFRTGHWVPVHVVGFADGSIEPCGKRTCYHVGKVNEFLSDYYQYPHELVYGVFVHPYEGESWPDSSHSMLACPSDWSTLPWEIDPNRPPVDQDFIAVHWDNCACHLTLEGVGERKDRYKYCTDHINLYQMMNQYRFDTDPSKPYLVANRYLCQLAQKFADDLASICQMGHIGVGGEDISDRKRRTHYLIFNSDCYIEQSWGNLREIVAYAPDAETAMTAWMNSRFHNLAILATHNHEVGIASASSSHCESVYNQISGESMPPGQLIWVCIFGGLFYDVASNVENLHSFKAGFSWNYWLSELTILPLTILPQDNEDAWS